MAKTPEQIAHRNALKARDWALAKSIVLANPGQFGAPPPGVSDAIAAVANDPLEPGWMIVEWSVQANDCQGSAGCKPYGTISNQFDHLPASASQADADAWFAAYVKNRVDAGTAKDQLGTTLFLLKVETTEPITDFDGVAIG